MFFIVNGVEEEEVADDSQAKPVIFLDMDGLLVPDFPSYFFDAADEGLISQEMLHRARLLQEPINRTLLLNISATYSYGILSGRPNKDLPLTNQWFDYWYPANRPSVIVHREDESESIGDFKARWLTDNSHCSIFFESSAEALTAITGSEFCSMQRRDFEKYPILLVSSDYSSHVGFNMTLEKWQEQCSSPLVASLLPIPISRMNESKPKIPFN